MIFITYALGFLSAAPLLSILDAKLGRSRLFMLSQVLLCFGFTTIVCTPPFAVVVVAFFFLGFGAAIFLAVSNSWIVNLMNGTVVLGFCHGMYGVSPRPSIFLVASVAYIQQLGGVISPLIATAMVSKGIRWSRFYLILLGVAAFCLPFMGWSYRGFERDAPVQLISVLERTASRQNTPNKEPTRRALLAKSFKNRTTVLGSLFIL